MVFWAKRPITHFRGKPNGDDSSTKTETPQIALAGSFLGKTADGAMMIACGQDALKITKVQPAGKTSMTASDFLNGSGLAIGAFLHL